MKLPQLAPGAEAGEKAGGGAGGARDHKQQFLRQNGNDNIRSNYLATNCQNTKIQSQIIIFWIVVLLPD